MKNGSIRAYQKNKGYESIPRELLQNTKLSLEAIGLLCHLQSYPDNWRLYKTELYTRFESNKRTVINRIWKELVSNNYLLEFKKRSGQKYEYRYLYSLEPFTEKEKGDIYEQLRHDGFLSIVDFRQLNKDKSNATDNKLTIKEINYKKEAEESSLRSLSSADDDDENINTTIKTNPDNLNHSEPTSSKHKSMDKVMPFLQGKEFIKPLALSLLFAGIGEKDCSEIIEYIATLPKVDQQVSDLVNAQIRANEQESKTNGLTNYKAYFLTGLKQKLHNANLDVRESNITNPETVSPLPKVTLHNWLE